MALNPPVIFLQGDWESNTTFLKNMTQEQQELYGFTAQSGINNNYLDSDPDNINGSSKMIAMGVVNQINARVFIAIGYFTPTIVSYSSDPDNPTYNPTYSQRIKLVENTTGLYIMLVSAQQPASQRDPRIKINMAAYPGYFGANFTIRNFGFDELRIMSGGLVSTKRHWVISFTSPGITFGALGSNHGDIVRVNTFTENGSIGTYTSGQNPDGIEIDLNNPGASVLQKASQANAWKATSTQIPGLAPFIIWDNNIYAQVAYFVFVQMGGILL